MNRRLSRRSSAFLALGLSVALTATTVRAQTTYGIIDLGTLPGTTASVAANLNDRGDVVGHCVGDAAMGELAFVWRDGVMIDLGRLADGNYATATAINTKGIVVGDGDTGNFRPQSWVTTAAGLYNFFPNNGGNTHAVAIGDNGAIGGYYTKSLSGWVNSWHGSIWTPDPKDARKYRQVDLPVLVGIVPKFKGTTAPPMAFNQTGQAAGYATNEVVGQHACFWNNDATHSIVDLGTLPGDWSSIGWAMNDYGQVVGESHPPFGSRPVVWNNDTAHTPSELPLLPGDNYGTATAINDLGQVLGWSAVSEPGTWNVSAGRFVIWRDGGVFELQSLLDATGDGWTLTDVAAINNLGQIVGFGQHDDQSRAFLMTPVTP